MIRVGTVSYLNARPLADPLDPNRFQVRAGHPSEVAAWLHAGDVDLALVPVGALLSTPAAFRIVPGVCIGAEGPVDSVVLAGHSPPGSWSTIRLDGVSRTSTLLARLLVRGPLAARLAPGVALVDVAPCTAWSGASEGEGALIIGDAALALDPDLSRVDLAEAWSAWTGLPFVFAVWAGRPDLEPAVVAEVAACGRAGVASIATRWSGGERAYLTRRIRYTLDDSAMLGLRRFVALARAAGWASPGADLQLYAPLGRAPTRHEPLERALAGGIVDPSELAEAPLSDLIAAASVRARAPLAVVAVVSLPPHLDPGRRAAWTTAAGRIGATVREAGAPSSAIEVGGDAVAALRAVAIARLSRPADEPVAVALSEHDDEVCAAALHAGADVLEVRLAGDPLSWTGVLTAAARVVRDSGRDAVGLPALDGRRLTRRVG